MIRICRRGHLVEGDNARPVGRTKYQQCRTCERMTGFDVQVQRPLWNNNGTIRVPSKACSLNDCLSVVPDSWDPEVEINVYCKDDHLMSFFLTPLE
jgi:hypothetical protein